MYATQADMETRYGVAEIIQLTDKDLPRTNVVVVAVLNQALSDADDEINGYLQGRYPLPLASVPKIINLWACEIARYRLYDNRAPEQIRKRYEDVVKALMKVAEGKLQLGLDAADAPAPQTDSVQISANDREFTKDKLKDY